MSFPIHILFLVALSVLNMIAPSECNVVLDKKVSKGKVRGTSHEVRAEPTYWHTVTLRSDDRSHTKFCAFCSHSSRLKSASFLFSSSSLFRFFQNFREQASKNEVHNWVFYIKAKKENHKVLLFRSRVYNNFVLIRQVSSVSSTCPTINRRRRSAYCGPWAPMWDLCPSSPSPMRWTIIIRWKNRLQLLTQWFCCDDEIYSKTYLMWWLSLDVPKAEFPR